MPVLRLQHGAPAELALHPPADPAPQGDLTGLALVLCQEDAEDVGPWGSPLPQGARDHVGKVELRGLGEARETEAEDAIKVKGLEGLLRHVRRHDRPQRHAALQGRGPARPGPLRRVQAELLLHEDPRDLPRPEGDGDLVARIALAHDRAVVVDVLGGGRLAPAVALVHAAGLGVAVGAGQDEVAAAGVEDDLEALRRLAHTDGAPVGALVVHRVSDHGECHLLPGEIQGDGLAQVL
mmetsp:Transcript_100329/g.292499  ORF Transcript_100329/g.292499 Transcript_100329/m.292499 type:complete len:237 (-) Transcript_100329:109-819(-)